MPLPPQRALDDLVVFKLWALSAAFERRLAAELAVFGLSVAAFRLIGEVMREPDGLRQGELARRLGVRPPTVSAAVTRLERDGLVVRVQDPDDPRARRVCLAPGASLGRGEKLLAQLEAVLVAGTDPAARTLLGQQLDDLRVRLETTPAAGESQ